MTLLVFAVDEKKGQHPRNEAEDDMGYPPFDSVLNLNHTRSRSTQYAHMTLM